MSNKIKVGIVGGTGYTGVELLRLLAQHPNAELHAITSRGEAGTAVSDMFPSLRGRYDLVLKFIARHPGCTSGELTAHARSVEPHGDKQVGGYIANLRDRHQMIEHLRPIFAKPTARNSWLNYIGASSTSSWTPQATRPGSTWRPISSSAAG